MSGPAKEHVDVTPAVLAGSPYETFFRANYAPLVRLLAVSADDVEDVVQEAFIQAHLHWPKISGYDDPRAWVRLVAARRILSRERGRSRKRQAIERLSVSPDHNAVSQESPSTVDLATQVKRLPPRQRMAVTLFYLCDLSVSDVAATMGISLGAVKATLAAARKTLRLTLENDDDT
jgi:RNA polymerase sigma-70 factor (ECF subfamily)